MVQTTLKRSGMDHTAFDLQRTPCLPLPRKRSPDGVHSFVCKRAPAKTIRHQVLSDLIAHASSSAGVPVTKEPSGLFRSDSKRPDGLTLVPLSSGKAPCWDVTVTCPLAQSYINAAARDQVRRQSLPLPAMKKSMLILMGDISLTLGVSNTSARQLLFDLRRKITESTGEAREASFLFQRCSVLVQRFNAILFRDSLPAQDCTDEMIVLHFVFASYFKLPQNYIYRG